MIKNNAVKYPILTQISACIEREDTKEFLKQFKGDGELYYDDGRDAIVPFSDDRIGWLTEVTHFGDHYNEFEYTAERAEADIKSFVQNIYNKLLEDSNAIYEEYVQKEYLSTDANFGSKPYYYPAHNDINLIASIEFQLTVAQVPEKYFDVYYYDKIIDKLLLNKSILKVDQLIQRAFILNKKRLTTAYIDGLLALNNSENNVQESINEEVATMFRSIRKSTSDEYIKNNTLHHLVTKEIFERFNALTKQQYGQFTRQYTNAIEIYRIVNTLSDTNHYKDSLYTLDNSNLNSDVKINVGYIKKFSYLLIHLIDYDYFEDSASSNPIIFTNERYEQLNILIDYFVKNNRTLYVSQQTMAIIEAMINLYTIIKGLDNIQNLQFLINLRDKITHLEQEKKLSIISLNNISSKIKHFA